MRFVFITLRDLLQCLTAYSQCKSQMCHTFLYYAETFSKAEVKAVEVNKRNLLKVIRGQVPLQNQGV